MLDFREDVRREEDGLPAVRRLGDTATELLLHERVEAARRLVQQKYIRSRRERCDERDLLAIALRVGAGALVELEVEARHELGAVPHVDVAVEVAEKLEAFLTGQLRPKAHVARNVGDVTMAGFDVAGVDALDLRGTRGRADEAEEQAEGRRLAGPVGAEESEHLAVGHVEGEVVECDERAEPLRQAHGADRGFWHVPEARSLRWPDSRAKDEAEAQQRARGTSMRSSTPTAVVTRRRCAR